MTVMNNIVVTVIWDEGAKRAANGAIRYIRYHVGLWDDAWWRPGIFDAYTHIPLMTWMWDNHGSTSEDDGGGMFSSQPVNYD